MKRLAPLLLLVFTSCWEVVSYPDRLAWANDDSAIGVLMLTFEQQPSSDPLSGTTNKRNFSHQVYVRTPSGEQTPVGPSRSGQSGGSFFFMKTAGYFLVTSLGSNGLEWNLLTLDGTYRLLDGTPLVPAEGSCALRDYLPSPDGAFIARIERSASCDAAVLTVGFLNASTLSLAAPATTLPARYWSDWTWTVDGRFIAVANTTAGARAWKLGPSSQPQETAVPTCTSPKTASSDVSSDGRLVYLDGSTIKIGAADPSKAFGCGLR